MSDKKNIIRIIWDVVISEEIEDIDNEIGALNWKSLSTSPGLSTIVNQRIKEDWLVIGGFCHGIEDGKEVWVQPMMQLLKNPYPGNKKITEWKRITSFNLHKKNGKDGLVEIVNEQIKNGWNLVRYSSLSYDIHKGIGKWGISMWKEMCCRAPSEIPNEG
tara:strand:+ start:1798 stop:2277 length:480 start_codon:yes stop_codon:yes gene_type:complete